MLEYPRKPDILVTKIERSAQILVSRFFPDTVIIDHDMGAISRKLEKGSSETIR